MLNIVANHMKTMDHPEGCSCCALPTGAAETLDEVLWSKSICAAASSGDLARVQQILARSNGQAVHSNGRGGFTGHSPLHYASRAGHIEIVKLLLSNNADPNRQTTAGGATALHRAAFSGHLQIVKLLLDYGASPLLHDRDGCTALDKSISQGHEAVTRLLREYIGVISTQNAGSVAG
jgi:ankyrin repeat protein